ncbi:DNA-binding protein [Flavobacterium sp. RSP46]|uniref:virulence RhuM family protein n=1 Tax=Flavobacterium sp. RSP46 TaxID=2497486 RepID=UPI000F85F46D|nr:RhuM family protein [Flavobacterium sp. RSP46]RTY91116.1 DNA-binding protein [Flavobacterium sp. RSP46]
MHNEIVIYQAEMLSSHIEVRIEDETVWLTQLQMVDLFQSTKQNISLHINNVFKEGELDEFSTVKEYLTVQQEGSRKIKRRVKLYNLDVIISVGYRVKSKTGTQFRIWATNTLKSYLLKGYAIQNRIENIEKKIFEHDQKIEILLNTSLPLNQGIFYDGQIFDAHSFVSRLIKSAKKSILLIDNFVDETVLIQLSKREKGVGVIIYTKDITKQLKLDLERFNTQYELIEIKEFAKSHDRFLIIDETEVYHIGASLKDLGKKWFAFSKLNIDPATLLGKLY